ncbi:transglutaminaseTgpA domain-containing protein [Acinetobacter sp. c3-l95]|uniref:transglutaminase family protein n=1 Tax=Acinetobacter sp. c3-l95 TaxID=3342804 RepID=UPI0035B7AAC4
MFNHIFKSAAKQSDGLHNENISNKNLSYSKAKLDIRNQQALLLSLFAVLIPHMFFMPIALSIIIALFLIIFQYYIWQNKSIEKIQKSKIIFGTFALGLVIIYTNFKTFLGVDAGCALLAWVLFSKSLETKTYRDAIVLLNFALFIVASLFLYSQNLLVGIAGFIGVLSCFYSLYRLQNDHHAYQEVIEQPVKKSVLAKQTVFSVLKLVGIALPLMIALFVFMPRFPPLWSIPTPSDVAKTGVSDEMSPGDISQLSQSGALAFRVLFPQGQLPNKSDLYWRAMTLDNYDGTTWRRDPSMLRGNRGNNVALIHENRPVAQQMPKWYTPKGTDNTLDTIDYKMIIEPTQQSWSYALEHSIGYNPLLLHRDLSVRLPFNLESRRQFDLMWIKSHPIANLQLDEQERQKYLAVPSGFNPRSQTLANEMFNQAGQNPQQYAQAVLDWIRRENFSYTLAPQKLGTQRVDDFLFGTRAGFCEHYAFAYTNLMRMAGVPTRVVVGYQGGKFGIDGQSWEVRQLDAHAWTEVWFEGQGWVRIDPTAAIAPERIEQGMQDYSAQNNDVYGGNFLSQAQGQWLTQLRAMSDYANYQWQSKIVGYDQESQANWLQKLSIQNLSQQLLVMLVSIIVMIGLMVWWLNRGQRVKQSALDKTLQNLSSRLAKYNLQRIHNEPILTWFKRIENEVDQPEQLKKAQDLYRQHMYIQVLPAAKLKQLLHLLAKINPCKNKN